MAGAQLGDGPAMNPGLEDVLLVAAGFVHLGFQATVTVLVYPALAGVDSADWDVVHAAHSRRITPIVVGVYGLAVVTGVVVVLAGASAWGVVSLSGHAVAMATTAAVAAPAHVRLGNGLDRALLDRLLAADRVRLVGAAVAAGAALAAVAAS